MSELLSRFAQHAQHSENTRTAVIDEAGAHSYAHVGRRALAISGALDQEIAPGERVAILVHPSVDFVATFFGVLFAGGCVVVLSPLHPAPETQYFCEDAGVRHVLVSAPYRDLASGLRDRCIIHALEELFETTAANPLKALAHAVSESRPALQLYTSGTTGKPKGAVLTHANLGVQQRLIGEAWGFSENDVLLHVLPLHHMHGLVIALLTALGAGSCVRFLPSFDARAVWEEMGCHEATVFMAVPAMYHRLFVAFDGLLAARGEDQQTRARFAANAKKLRLATSGSAALPVTLAERWRAITGSIPLERFGMTEIGVGLTNSLTGPRFAGSVGLPLPTVETRIVNDAEHDAEIGELWIRGPSVFAEYHQRDEETKKAFVSDPAGGQAWFRTGDTVTRDASLEGSPFKILGRTSVDILKSGGYKLSALEIEEVLREHPGVAEVAVVGLPDEAWGERVVACVIRRAAQQQDPKSIASSLSCDAETLRAFVRERLAPYKVPKDVFFFDELPKNALGKVLKPTLIIALECVGSVAESRS